MTNDPNDLVPAQEKLEWVTPKISLMDAGDTIGTKGGPPKEVITFNGTRVTGPS